MKEIRKQKKKLEKKRENGKRAPGKRFSPPEESAHGPFI
jgi:hypothetical protein